MKQVKLMKGDNMVSLKKLPDNSIDSIVTDPPYGLSFMNKKWDYDVPSVDFWKEVYRVLKPGGHILSFGGTRTYHRMVVNIEDAGFEIRDQIMWIYGSGFPKSLNIGKAVDKINGDERETTGKSYIRNLEKPFKIGASGIKSGKYVETKGNSQYEGWGTALKPANEPICVARKPISEKSIAENVMKWGTGGINIDGCRVGSDIIKSNGYYNLDNDINTFEGAGVIKSKEQFVGENHEGRFPANIIFECICDEVIKGDTGDIHTNPDCPCYQLDKQNKSTSRFFYVAKVSKKERNMGLDGIILQVSNLSLSLDYNTKKVELWESTDQKARHQEAMELLTKRGIDELSLKKVMENTAQKWNTGLYGKEKSDLFQMVTTFITLTATNLITELKILNVSVELNIRENILECISKMDFGGNFVVNVMNGNPKMIIIEQKEDGCLDNVKSVELKQPLSINAKEKRNIHSTVKPINLLTYLCRLVTPENGIVLDPFMGSGSTGISALLEGFRFCGMEMDEDYFKIAEARISAYEKYKPLLK